MAVRSPVIYIDTLIALAVLSLMMDYLLLWATSKVTKVERKPWSLALGALLGTSYFITYYLSARGALPYYGWLRFWPVVLGTSLAMILVAFYPLTGRQFLRVTGIFYFIAVSSGGAGIAAGYALGWGVLGQLLAAIAAILLTAELGWGVVQKSLWQRLYHVPIEIVLFGRPVRMIALLDTGNTLRDPLKGSPVIVVEHSAIAPLLPEHLRDVMRQMEQGDLSQISRLLTSARLSARFRVIPFASLGNEKGLLIGLRPDRASVEVEGRRIVLPDAIIGLSPHSLDPHGAYRALLHPEFLQRESGDPLVRPAATTKKEGESVHASTLG